jgi:hypothetical protein
MIPPSSIPLYEINQPDPNEELEKYNDELQKKLLE